MKEVKEFLDYYETVNNLGTVTKEIKESSDAANAALNSLKEKN